MHEVYTSKFNNHILLSNDSLKVNLTYGFNDRQVYFEVDHSFEWQDRSNKVAITKWLLAAWTRLLMMSPKDYIVCHPAGHDKKKEYRISAYKKMGFVLVSESTMVWGNLDKFFSDMMDEIDKEEFGGNPDDI